jgi:hypothetical protein
MSTEHMPLISDTNNDINVTSFNGGPRGRCVQLTGPSGNVQLTKEQVAQLMGMMDHWTVDDLGGSDGGALPESIST